MLSVRTSLRRFAAARAGVAAVEFAIILPMIVMLFFGLFELSNGMACRERVDSLAGTTSDLVAQSTTMTNADITNVYTAASAILYPYPSTARIVLTSLSYVDDVTGKVEWSDASSGVARTVNTQVTVPTGVIASGGSVIMSEVYYTYNSPTTYVVNQPVTMNGRFFSRPRRSLQVTRS